MKHTSISKSFLIINILMGFLAIVLSLMAAFIYLSQIQLNEKQQIRHKSYKLAIELRKSTEDLTKYARAFVTTGNPKFRSKYYNVLDVRNGIKPRPDGKTIPLRKIIEQAGYTDDELYMLKQSEDNSNDLVKTQITAMNAIKGLYDDGYGNFTVEKEPDTAFAINILFDEKYEQDKAQITEPINELLNILDKRTLSEVKRIQKKNNYYGLFLDMLLILLIGIIIASYLIINRKIVKPLNRIKKHSEHIATGDFSHRLKPKYDDEIGQLANAINKMSEGMHAKSKFVQQIGDGKLDVELEPLSENDVMAKSLLTMRDNLIKARKAEEKRKKAEEEQNWMTRGLARFGEILRKDNDNLEKLSQNIISNLVKYIDAEVGGLFIINDNEPEDMFIQMMACFAYDRRRSEQKRIEMEEGLIGRAVFEAETIFMTEVPDTYLNIKSGLGDDKPKSLLIVPLKLNEEVFGVVELASLKTIHDYQIDFVERVGESIASTLSSSKIAQKTAELLQESKERAEEMAAQEEEMRQNIEELQTTQEALDQKDKQQKEEIKKLVEQNKARIEEIAKKEMETQAVLDALSQTTYLIEFNLEGKIISANDFALRTIGKSKNEVVGKNQRQFIKLETQEQKIEYNKLWTKLATGKTVKQTNKYVIDGKELWLADTYTPVYDTNGEVYKVLKISYNITKEREREILLGKQSEELRRKEEDLRNSLNEMKEIQQTLIQKEEEQKKEIERLKHKEKVIEELRKEIDKYKEKQ